MKVGVGYWYFIKEITKEGAETVGYSDVFQMITNSKPSLIIFSKGEK